MKKLRIKFRKPNVSVNSIKSWRPQHVTKYVWKRIEHWNFAKITKNLTIVAIVLAIGSSWVWYTKVYMTPERKFWIALDNSMSTPSVMRTITNGGSGNLSVQDYRFHYAPQQVVENRVIYTEKSATVDTKVQTEGVITATKQFLKYSDFRSKVQGSDSKDLGSLLGKWAVNPTDKSTENQLKLNFLNDKVTIGIFGNFSAEFRHDILRDMQTKNVYGSKLSTPTDDEINGRKVRVYQVSVDIKEYVSLLQRSFIAAGYGEFPPLAPENYRDGVKLNGAIIVDAYSNSVVTISFGGRTENYSNYGVIKHVDTPEASLTINELQSQVQAKLQ